MLTKGPLVGRSPLQPVRHELFQLGVAAHLKINLLETVCDLTVAWIQLARLLEIGERSVPAILAPINRRLDQKRFRIIRQLAANDRQLVTCPVEITSREDQQ